MILACLTAESDIYSESFWWSDPNNMLTCGQFYTSQMTKNLIRWRIDEHIQEYNFIQSVNKQLIVYEK